MNDDLLQELAEKLQISKDQILREEAEIFFLNELADDKISAHLIFYGGTALRLAYNSPRFSEDIDLIATGPLKFNTFKLFIEKIRQKNTSWEVKDIKDKRNTMFTLFLIKEDKLKHNFSLKIEVHKSAKKIKLHSELSLIKSPASIFEPLLLVPTLEELKNLKEQAIAGRKKARDIFDLWYISQTLKINFVLPKKIPAYSEREFRNELQVFLPKKYYPIILQLYGKINPKNK